MVWLILLVACVPVAWVLWSIDDWGRDWTTNRAETDPAAIDPLLRPLSSHHPPAEQAERIAAWIERQPRWSRQRMEAEPEGGGSEGIVHLHLVRRTPLLRFRDDIHVILSPTAEGGSILHATSQSRIGKGDLGQNPRNLRELIKALAIVAVISLHPPA